MDGEGIDDVELKRQTEIPVDTGRYACQGQKRVVEKAWENEGVGNVPQGLSVFP